VRSWSNIPIIVLSIQADELQKVRLLRLGADDYVVKPFGISELLARVEAALRRQLKSADRDPVVKAGPLSIDLVTRVVTLAGRRVQLTRKEYALLHMLATHAGLVVTHQQLMKEVWGGRGGNIQYLRILVRKLRQKVEIDATNPSLIISESGVGYRLHRDGNGNGISGRGGLSENGSQLSWAES
jgi:two-component system, OmpR family, KDP operon response regulator KdpE